MSPVIIVAIFFCSSLAFLLGLIIGLQMRTPCAKWNCPYNKDKDNSGGWPARPGNKVFVDDDNL